MGGGEKAINWTNKTGNVVHARINPGAISQETDNSNYIGNPPSIAFSPDIKQCQKGLRGDFISL